MSGWSGATSGFWGEAATAQVRLTHTQYGSAIVGRRVSLAIGSSAAVVGTDGSGFATAGLTIPSTPGVVGASGSFAGDSCNTGSSTSTSFTVFKRPTNLAA